MIFGLSSKEKMPSLQISKLIEALKAAANREHRGLKQKLLAKGLEYPSLGKERRMEVLNTIEGRGTRWSCLTAEDAVDFLQEDRNR